MFRRTKKKLLVGIPHFFDLTNAANGDFGSTSIKNLKMRSLLVKNCVSSLVAELEKLNFEFQIIVYGVGNQNVIKPDVLIETPNPRHLPWYVISDLHSKSNRFDYIMIIEDDIKISSDCIMNLLDIDKELNENELIIPNRVENYDSLAFCVDLLAMPGWRDFKKRAKGYMLQMPENPHSGVLLMSKQKFQIGYLRKVTDEPTILIGDYMASALKNISSSFDVYRAIPTATTLTVDHMDSWTVRQIQIGNLDENLLESRISINKILEINLG